MKPPPNRQLTSVLHKLGRLANESEHKSLFGLLLLIEHELCKHLKGAIGHRIERHEAVNLVSQRRPIIRKPSRYIE